MLILKKHFIVLKQDFTTQAYTKNKKNKIKVDI